MSKETHKETQEKRKKRKNTKVHLRLEEIFGKKKQVGTKLRINTLPKFGAVN